jgi:phosphohistidine phosphatase
MLLRHAKSDWPDVPDRDRPLAKRGRRDAPVVGRWLRDRGYLPEVVVCSDARRTRQTWELIAPELGGSPAVRFEPRAYGASAMALLYLVRELPGQCRSALLIGHNPGIAELADSLAAGEARARRLGFPTAAVAVFGLAGDWPALDPGTPGQASLLGYTTPAELRISLSWIAAPRGRGAAIHVDWNEHAGGAGW